jgi:spermidine/putrescine transport system permease protein
MKLATKTRGAGQGNMFKGVIRFLGGSSSKPLILLFPGLVFMLAFFLAPALVLLLQSFWTGREFQIVHELTLSNYVEGVLTPLFQSVTLNALLIGFMTATITIMLSYPLAYYLAFEVERGRNLIIYLVFVSMLSGYIVRVYAWRTILGRTGLVNSLLLFSGVIKEPLLFLIFNRASVIVALVNIFVPFAMLPILSALSNIPRELVEAARDLGANSLVAFLRVTLPLSMTGVLSAFAYTMVLSAGDYITPELLGGLTGSMIGRNIAQQFVLIGNRPLGSALSFLVLAMYAIMFLGLWWGLRRLRLLPK